MTRSIFTWLLSSAVFSVLVFTGCTGVMDGEPFDTPTIQINSPSEGDTIDMSTLTVSGTAEADAGFANVTLSAPGLTDVVLDGGDLSTWSGQLTGLTDGALTITATVTDSEGVAVSDQVTVTVDLPVAGSPSIYITSHQNGELVDADLTLSGTAMGAMLSRVFVTVDGGAEMDATGLETWSLDLTALPAGDRTIVATAVEMGGATVSETITLTVVPGLVCDAGVDLEITSITNLPAMTVQNGAYRFDVQYRNTGTTDYTPGEFDQHAVFYINTVPSLDGNETLLGVDGIGDVDACSDTVTQPVCLGPFGAIPAGTYYVIGRIDLSFSTFTDSDTSNNVFVSATTLEVSANIADPDFAVTIDSVSTPALAANELFSATLTVENLGDPFRSAPQFEAWLEMDGNGTRDFLDEARVECEPLPSPFLCDGTSMTLTCEQYLNQGAFAGGTPTTWDFVVHIDRPGLVIESDENNNQDISVAAVTVSPAYMNLTIDSITFTDTSWDFHEGAMPVDIVISNTGTTDSGPFFIDPILSTDTTLGNNDDISLHEEKMFCTDWPEIDSIAGGETVTVSGLVLVSGPDAETCDLTQPVYFGAIIDPLGTLLELDTNDNEGITANTIALNSNIDFGLQTPTLTPTTVSLGGSTVVSVDAEAVNTGTGTVTLGINGGCASFVATVYGHAMGSTVDPATDLEVGSIFLTADGTHGPGGVISPTFPNQADVGALGAGTFDITAVMPIEDVNEVCQSDTTAETLLLGTVTITP